MLFDLMQKNPDTPQWVHRDDRAVETFRSATHGLEKQFGQLRERVGINVAFDVALALLFQDLVDGNEDARFFDVAKRVVDGGMLKPRWRTARLRIL